MWHLWKPDSCGLRLRREQLQEQVRNGKVGLRAGHDSHTRQILCLRSVLLRHSYYFAKRDVIVTATLIFDVISTIVLIKCKS